MKITTLERAMRAFMEGTWNPVLEGLNGTRVLHGPGLAEFAAAASTLAERADGEGDEPTVPLPWI